MLTLQKVNKLVKHSVTTNVPENLRHRISCGIQAFSLQAFTSMNANGRSLAANRKTGESRVYRVIHDERTPNLLMRLLLSLLPKVPLIYCSLDHSQFGPFCIAILAVSFRKGRALPVWCQVNKSESALIAPLLDGLDQLSALLPEDQKLVLVMDRWFCGPKLFELIIKHHWYFIARAKYDRRVWVPWEERCSIPIGEISHYETVCWYHRRELRMIRSELKPGMKQEQPWFLLTNLPRVGQYAASRVQVLHRYEERFEIEEAFKDVKWLQRLEWQRARKVESMQVLLLFTFFGWWLAWICFRHDQTLQQRRARAHPKQRLSWFRTYWEALHQLFWPDSLRFTALQPLPRRIRAVL
ncbi:MAG: transposase [Patescibacteria group bacterium]